MKFILTLVFTFLVIQINLLAAPCFFGIGEVTCIPEQFGFTQNSQKMIFGDSDDPTSVAKTASKSSIYFREGNAGVYFKEDDGLSTNWILLTGAGGSSALDDLTNVTITATAEGDVLRYRTSDWVNEALSGEAYSILFLGSDGSTISASDNLTWHNNNTLSATGAFMLNGNSTLAGDVTITGSSVLSGNTAVDGGLVDANVPNSINLGSPTATSLHTAFTATSIVGALNELKETTVAAAGSHQIVHTGYDSLSGTKVKLKTEAINTEGGLITADNTTYTKVTINASANVTAAAAGEAGSANDVFLEVYNSSDVLLFSSKDTGEANQSGNVSINREADEGDYVVFNSSNALDDDTDTVFSVVANTSGGTPYQYYQAGTYAGFASSPANSRIPYYSNRNVNINEDELANIECTAADSGAPATNGCKITCTNTNGCIVNANMWAIVNADNVIGWSLNSSQLNTAIYLITEADRKALCANISHVGGGCSVAILMEKDDILRPHHETTTTSGFNGGWGISIMITAP
jgi:hypothetical protein